MSNVKMPTLLRFPLHLSMRYAEVLVVLLLSLFISLGAGRDQDSEEDPPLTKAAKGVQVHLINFVSTNLKIPGYEGKCCTTSITFEAAGSKSKAAKKWPAYVGGPYHFWDIHNGAPVYRMSTISKSLLHKDVDRFIFLNDDGKWTVNNKINDRGVFRKGGLYERELCQVSLVQG